MNLGGINVGKVVGARGNSSQGGNGANTNTSKDMVKVFYGKKVVGLIWRTGEVVLLGVEFSVVGGSSTHAVEGADMETMRLYQMLYPNINSSRVWQIGCGEQTMIGTRADKFVICHEASKDAPLSECVIGREAPKDAPHRRTLSHATDLNHQGSQ
jgi:hypothetical protein